MVLGWRTMVFVMYRVVIIVVFAMCRVVITMVFVMCRVVITVVFAMCRVVITVVFAVVSAATSEQLLQVCRGQRQGSGQHQQSEHDER